MKKVLLITFAVCVLGVSALHAVPVLGPPVGQCTAAPGVSGSATDLILPYTTWTGANFACEQQDKIYSNFSAGLVPTGSTVRLQVQPIGTSDFHTLSLQGNFLTNFTFSFDIAIDMVTPGVAVPNERIVAVTGDISNPPTTGTPSNVKTVFTEGGANLGSLTSVTGSPGATILVSQTALHVVDVYTANGGGVVSISNTFQEQPIPEPFSFALMGSGIGLILLSRRIRRA
jgi:hypothetical protein